MCKRETTDASINKISFHFFYFPFFKILFEIAFQFSIFFRFPTEWGFKKWKKWINKKLRKKQQQEQQQQK